MQDKTLIMTTRQPIKPAIGRWWKFSRYEIKKGYIGPAADATLSTYDPLTDQTVNSGARPCEELVSLVQEARYRVSDASAATPDAATEAASLAWCQRYGLLGVLLQRVQKVELQQQIDTEKELTWSQTTRYQRTPQGWQMQNDQKRSRSGTPIRGKISIHPIDKPETTVESLGQTWATFFPTIPASERESYPYPKPTTAAFWQLYQEPVKTFFDNATLLERAMTTLAKGRGTFANGAISDSSKVDDYALAIHDLNSYAGTIRWSLTEENGAFVQRWASPALFASLAMMVLQNLAGGQTVRTCRTCGGVFMSSAYQAQYCSTRCRQTMNKRTVRRKARTKNR